MKRIRAHWCVLVGVVPIMFAAVTVAQEKTNAPGTRVAKRVASEPAVSGITPEAFFAQQQALHDWLVAQVPAGTDKTGVSVSLTERDRQDLATPFIPGSATPMRVGVVKSIAERVGFARGQSLSPRSARGKKAANSTFERTANGGFAWATTISSPGALALRVHFENFSLPPTAEVYILNSEGEAHGPYTGAGPHGSGEFWSHSIASSTGTVLLIGPADRRGLSFSITEIAHVAIDFPRAQGGEGGVASFCTYNAPCVENNACTSDPAVNDAEGAVAKMRWIAGAFINICSGGLIADTDASSQIPFFMTANHCISKNKDAKNLETFFLYTATCGTTNCPSSFGQPFSPPSTFGASVKASGTEADFTLLQLNEDPPVGTTFLGWNNAPVAFTSGAALHRVSHPSGAPQAYSEHAVDTNIGTCFQTARGPWIYSDDIVGETEGGSSGSPVVNAAGEFVGQLTGCCPVGGGNCSEECNANNHTIDGAFAHYFSSVAEFLDPSPCEPTTADCSDGVDNDCDGLTDCNDTNGGAEDCTGDPACDGGGCVNPGGLPPGASCVLDVECCSDKCKGQPGNKTCK